MGVTPAVSCGVLKKGAAGAGEGAVVTGFEVASGVAAVDEAGGPLVPNDAADFVDTADVSAGNALAAVAVRTVVGVGLVDSGAVSFPDAVKEAPPPS